MRDGKSNDRIRKDILSVKIFIKINPHWITFIIYSAPIYSTYQRVLLLCLSWEKEEIYIQKSLP